MGQSRTYAISDPAAVAAKVTAAGGPAIDPTQPTGQASAEGITIGWSISYGKILITILHKPWVAPYSTIWSHIEAILGNPV
jgi:hypothetical protein